MSKQIHNKKQLGCTLILLTLCVLLFIPVYLNVFIPFYYISSNSMDPILPKGSLIIINNRMPHTIDNFMDKPVVYFDPLQKNIIVHRVIGAQGNYIITKGDNNAFIDETRPHINDILGVVIYKNTFFVREN